MKALRPSRLPLFCAVCRARFLEEFDPSNPNIDGRLRCPTAGCLSDQGAVDQDGKPVEV